MNTLMEREAYNRLLAIRNSFGKEAAGVFVPWAGKKLRQGGGIYYVGIATDGEWGREQGYPTIQSECLQITKTNLDDQTNGPFWRYFNKLSEKLLQNEARSHNEKIGWSNLIKIGRSRGTPDKDLRLVQRQREECAQALKTEFSALRNSLIVIVSANEYGILEEALDRKMAWCKELQRNGIYWWRDPNRSNLYVWGYHPNFACREKGLFEKQLNSTIDLATAAKFNWIIHSVRK